MNENERIEKADLELEVEELEPIVAPGSQLNHNETFVTEAKAIDAEIEELEEVMALGVSLNHNETLLSDHAS